MPAALDLRHAAHPRDVRTYDTAALRRDFLIENLFEPDALKLTYSMHDRMIVGGAMPVSGAVKLASYRPTGTPHFLDRRELGTINIGGPGRVIVDGDAHDVGPRDALYVGLGHADLRFESLSPARPARFYLVSTPAHRAAPTILVTEAAANTLRLGALETANKRVIRQYIMPGNTGTNQLVMGLTTLETGSVWNSMPTHTHDRRAEVYLYFDLPETARAFHFMGEPQETRHLVIANEQAVIAPGWSIHCGAATSAYSFIWAMGGDNVDYADMDAVPMEALR